MSNKSPVWLINNRASGSNTAEALAAFEQSLADAGFRAAHRTSFPEQDLPNPAILDAAGIDRVVIYAGDGTINAVLQSLAGWNGAALVLPGGTMNLLYHRLFGTRTIAETLRQVAAGHAVRQRPGVIRCGEHTAYAGLLAGPGTAWNGVREAIRAQKFADLAGGAREALEITLSGPQVACADPVLGRPEGYPLILLEPHGGIFQVIAYHAEGTGQFLEQAWALLRRNFREGPHEELGEVARLALHSVSGETLDVLVDGEPRILPASSTFTLAECALDLLAAEPDGD